MFVGIVRLRYLTGSGKHLYLTCDPDKEEVPVATCEFETADRCRVEVTVMRTETIAISVEGPLDLASQDAPSPNEQPPPSAKWGRRPGSTRERIAMRPQGSRVRAVGGNS